MANRINSSALKGVPLNAFAAINSTTAVRYFIRIPEVPINNIRLLGVLNFAKQSNSSESGEYYVVSSHPVRARRDSLLIQPPVSIVPSDVLQFIPLYDFDMVVVNDIF